MPDNQPINPQVAPTKWHNLAVTAVLKKLKVDPSVGLSMTDLDERVARFGRNEAATVKPEPFIKELLESFTEPLQLLLIAVGVLSLIFGELSDAIAIFIIITVVATVETLSELRAKRAIDALKQLTAPTARVLRDGDVHEIPAAELVPGDIIILEAGDIIPADARVLTASGMQVDESSLTGEPQAVGKGIEPNAPDADLAERSSMVYSGTTVAGGDGRAVVVATGLGTELGQLGHLVTSEKEPPTPLQRSLRDLARVVLYFAIAASVGVPLIGVLVGRSFQEMLLSGLTLAFATIPEELPILVTVLLAVGGRSSPSGAHYFGACEPVKHWAMSRQLSPIKRERSPRTTCNLSRLWATEKPYCKLLLAHKPPVRIKAVNRWNKNWLKRRMRQELVGIMSRLWLSLLTQTLSW